MSRAAKFLTICLVIGIFLFSYALVVVSAREVGPGRVASRLKIRIVDGGSGEPALTVGFPAGLAEWTLTTLGSARALDSHGRETELREFWLRLKESNREEPLEFSDGGDRVQIWLE